MSTSRITGDKLASSRTSHPYFHEVRPGASDNSVEEFRTIRVIRQIRSSRKLIESALKAGNKIIYSGAV